MANGATPPSDIDLDVLRDYWDRHEAWALTAIPPGSIQRSAASSDDGSDDDSLIFNTGLLTPQSSDDGRIPLPAWPRMPAVPTYEESKRRVQRRRTNPRHYLNNMRASSRRQPSSYNRSWFSDDPFPLRRRVWAMGYELLELDSRGRPAHQKDWKPSTTTDDLDDTQRHSARGLDDALDCLGGMMLTYEPDCLSLGGRSDGDEDVWGSASSSTGSWGGNDSRRSSAKRAFRVAKRGPNRVGSDRTW